MPDWSSIDSKMTPTRIRIKALQEACGSGATEQAFHCSSACLCQASLRKRIGDAPSISKGDWTYIGAEYGEAMICDRPSRVLFVSMERPKKRETDSESFEKTQQSFRHSCRCRSNPHMGGTDTILKYLLDCGTPEERRCQQFALSNSVRCSPINTGSSSRSTLKMLEECRRHTDKIIEALRPHIIITQGTNPYCSVAHVLSLPPSPLPLFANENDRVGPGHRFANDRVGRGHRFAEVRRHRHMLVLRTAHPAHYPGFRWKRGELPAHLLKAIVDLRDRFGTSRSDHCAD